MTVDLLPLVSAWNSLQAKLRYLDDSGYRLPCIDLADQFVSEDQAVRQAAAAWCNGCPAVTECATYADAANEKHNTWGGRDRGPRNDKRRDVA